MATERQRAKAAITSRSSEEPELENILTDAAQYQLELTREANRHKETMRGTVGRIIGVDANAPLAIALIVVGIGLMGAIACYVAAYRSGDKDFWGRQAERSFAAAMTALSYVFGRGDRKTR